MTSTAISNYEAGKREPEFDTIKKLASYFNVSVDYLIGFSDLKDKPLTKEEEKMLSLFREYGVEDQKRMIELYLLLTRAQK